ncbi:MAG: OmpA family protein [Alphaproteobacteria bacterium]|nr:OmpA family protein [Alphaproteobacteria bacterium]MCW5744410.1 OmpA family protein [Alphaproteobacteria bacterium]
MKTKVGAVVAAALIAAPLAAQAQNLSPGFYVGIEGGLNFLHNLNPAIAGQTNSPRVGWMVGGVVGYDFIGPRVELEIPYRRNNVNTNYGLTKVESIAAMVNVLYDFFPQSMISPHLGAGVGLARVTASQTEFAYQGIAGVSAVFDDSFRISLDYKFFGTTNPSFAGASYRYLNHSAMLTLAYKFGAPAAAAPPPPTQPPAPKAYMVFFDFDRSTITATAATTIRQAAADAKAGQKTRIGVTGHADRSGSDAYNMALSLRRANAVKDALVREGIPAANITVVGRGESQPLVQTADGVREPQNRRVEIVLN